MLKKVLSHERTGDIIYDEIYIIYDPANKFSHGHHGTDKIIRENI